MQEERSGRISTFRKLLPLAGALLLLLVVVLLAWRAFENRDRGQPAPSVTATPTQGPASSAVDPFAQARAHMVKFQLLGRDITDKDVIEAMERIPRHEFVPEEYRKQAYVDHPLPIGFGQTISQPYIVALMTQLLKLKPEFRVLEVGTGSGYQAAILSDLCSEVYTVEIIEELATPAKERLERLGYDNVHVKHDDGYYGWEEHAPYDAIIVTAAPDHIPPPLIAQLNDGGRLVVPVGPPGSYQTLWLIEKKGEETISRNITGVIFVPLTGEH